MIIKVERKQNMKINARTMLVIGVILICVVSLNLAVYYTYIQKEDRGDTVAETEEIVDTVELAENFQNIFDNTVNVQSNMIPSNKIEQDKDIVYTSYKRQETQYDININIPCINVNHQAANELNQKITAVFYGPVEKIIARAGTQQTIYSVDYKAYVNDNILSLIIRANLKEGANAQRLIIMTYNYNLSSNEAVDFNSMLQYKGLDSTEVQSRIKTTIQQAADNASNLQEAGFSYFLRNVEDPMYSVEKTDTFFLGENKALYIIYPYGNNNNTSEFDLLVL